MTRHLVAAAACLIFFMASIPALAQGPRRSAPGFAPKIPTLTKSDVDRLLRVLPVLAKETGRLSSDPTTSMAPGNSPQQMPVEDLKIIEELLRKHGYAFDTFLVHLSTVVSTYMALSPEAFDKQLPTEQTPGISEMLADPKTPQEQKDAMRKQIAEAHANKELLRQQLTSMVSSENKKVVQPMLAEVKKALDSAETEAKKARAKRAEKAK